MMNSVEPLRRRLLWPLMCAAGVFVLFQTTLCNSSNCSLSQSLRWLKAIAFEHGAFHWRGVNAQAADAPAWLKPALGSGSLHAGAISWQPLEQGLEWAEIEVIHDEVVVDTMRLLRIEPQYYRFRVHVAPGAARDIKQWQTALGAKAIINGSYFGPGGFPSTPVRSNGRNFGPAAYDATHGAFVADQAQAELIDLSGIDWQEALTQYPEAMISYPLLLDENGKSRSRARDHWLASRSFVAMDESGRILLGTTESGYFSLNRLARFLASLPLNLRRALNLDGGPISCLSVKTELLEHMRCGEFEIAGQRGNLQSLEREKQFWKLPIVLAVEARDA